MRYRNVGVVIVLVVFLFMLNVVFLEACPPRGCIQGQVALSKSSSKSSSKSKSKSGSESASSSASSPTYTSTTEGDDVKNYVIVAPNTTAEEGQQASSLYSLFGGINITQSEEAKRCEDNIKLLILMAANEVITHDELELFAYNQYKQIEITTQPKRLFGLLWKTSGCHLLNGFSFFAWDDLWAKLPSKK